jgi:CheY-like chemotaxis protein
MSKETILIVEDNESILFNLKLSLEMNDYNVITALNGIEALKILREIKIIPDLILSDIMMPEMNGYDFFETISTDQKLNHIPFIFVSAKSSPNDIKLGKLLGVDDYITKPIDEEVMLAVIGKKIKKTKHLQALLENKINQDLKSKYGTLFNSPLSKNEKNNICLFVVEWNEIQGPIVTHLLPKNFSTKIDIDNVAIQLFQSTVSIFGQQGTISPESILLNVHNVGMNALNYFDFISDNKIRGGKKEIMISIIAPEINYLNSLKLRNTLAEISLSLKNDDQIDLPNFFTSIQTTLMYNAIENRE